MGIRAYIRKKKLEKLERVMEANHALLYGSSDLTDAFRRSVTSDSPNNTDDINRKREEFLKTFTEIFQDTEPIIATSDENKTVGEVFGQKHNITNKEAVHEVDVDAEMPSTTYSDSKSNTVTFFPIFGDSWFSPSAQISIISLGEEYRKLIAQYDPAVCNDPNAKEILADIIREHKKLYETLTQI